MTRRSNKISRVDRVIQAIYELGGKGKPTEIIKKVAEYEGITDISRNYTQRIWGLVEQHCSSYKIFRGGNNNVFGKDESDGEVKWFVIDAASKEEPVG